MKYEGLLQFLNLEYPCFITGADGICYPSLVHALAALGNPSEKDFISDGIYTLEETQKLWYSAKINWTEDIIDKIVRLIIQKYSNFTFELISYTKDTEIKYSPIEDPLQIIGKVTALIREGCNIDEIMKILNF